MTWLDKIKSVLSLRKYFGIAVAAGMVYWGLYFAQVSYTAGGFLNFVNGFVKSYVLFSVPLSVIIATLIGINIALVVSKIQYLKNLKSGSATSFFGILAGAFASGCPGCAVGFFPAFASVFGISATLASLPFGGIELQLVSVLLLAVSIFLLSNDKV